MLSYDDDGDDVCLLLVFLSLNMCHGSYRYIVKLVGVCSTFLMILKLCEA